MKREDFTADVDRYGYMIKYKGQNIGGAGVTQRNQMRGSVAESNRKYYRESSNTDIDALLSGRGAKRYLEAIEKIDNESSLYKVVCPVCGGELVYHLKNNKEFKVLIKENETIEEQICKNDNSNIKVYCSQNKRHRITEEIIEDAIEIAQSYGY